MNKMGQRKKAAHNKDRKLCRKRSHYTANDDEFDKLNYDSIVLSFTATNFGCVFLHSRIEIVLTSMIHFLFSINNNDRAENPAIY